MDKIIDVVHLKNFKCYKSVIAGYDKAKPTEFEIKTAKDNFYFDAKSWIEKWSWIAIIERLMNFRVVGESSYNKFEWITSKGLQS